ncbi:MAG: sugar ABC transporter permease [Clostridia bacterium]|nr:sugar ABC transporter permease [Clostridia bacterium]
MIRRLKNYLTGPKGVPYLFVAPFIIFFLLVYLYPLIMTIIMSFQQIDGPNHHEFIGLKNYMKLNSRDFNMALQTSGRYAVWDVIVLTIIPLLVACVLHSGLAKASNFFKSLFFIPSLTSIIVAGIVFRLAFGTLETATVNRALTFFGLQPVKWLSYAGPGNFVLILLTLWRWNGVNIVYYLSGLQAIPTDHYEAAQIDGANAWQKFIHVTLPGIRPVLIYVITITVLGGFSMFTESVALWQQNNAGGVGWTIVGYMYMVGFKKNNLGLASAVGLVLLGLVVAVNLIQLVLMGFFRKDD